MMPPGKYFIGDACYVLADDVYFNVWGNEFNFAMGIWKFKDTPIVVAPAAFGDGAYPGSDKHLSYVDSGTIGMIPYKLRVQRTEDQQRLGAVHTFDEDVHFKCTDGLYVSTSGDFELIINKTGFIFCFSDDSSDYEFEGYL